DSIANARCYEDLPENAIKYLKKIEDFTETKVSIVSVGPKRDQTMMISEI
ncbi:MAG: adenylosuccinate synthetase, partial [Clostridium sporogenes]|nr:adenylosuccinate synthetase [Clostridium sporogenes]